MKRAPFWGKLRLLLLVCCFLVLAVLVYKDYRVAARFKGVLNFAELDVDECIIWRRDFKVFNGSPLNVKYPTITIYGDEAQSFAHQFASTIRKYRMGVHFDGCYELAYPRQIIFKNKGHTTCELRFTHLYEDETLIDYRTKNPSLSGTMIIKKKAGPELEALIESFAAEEPNNSNKK